MNEYIVEQCADKDIDGERFEAAKKKALIMNRSRNGIGTLAEKTIHATVKNYLEPDTDYHEIPVNGYVADIYREGRIFEVQTANFNKLRPKLSIFLNDYEVTVVYPIPHVKWVRWMNPENGEIGKAHKSPKRGTAYEAFVQLYKIKQFIKHENFRFKILLLNMEEIRLLNGWSTNKKRGSVRYDRIPLELVDEIDITRTEDYVRFVPIELPDSFTAKDFAKEAHIPQGLSQVVLNILTYTDTVLRIGKKGNSILYSVPD